MAKKQLLVGDIIVVTPELLEVMNDSVFESDFHEFESEDQYDILRALRKTLLSSVRNSSS